MDDYVDELDEDDEIQIKFVEVSAKEGTNINALFEEVSIKLLERHHENNPGAGKPKLQDPGM